MNQLICKECGTGYDLNQAIWKCPCGGLLDLQFKARFPLNKIKKRGKTLWRYREALPLDSDSNIVSFGEGFTPLLEMKLDGRIVYIKQDFLFPSGSYKDRGSALIVSKAKELGIKKVVEDSSGNAGASIAAYCAKAGIQCDIYVPATNSAGKQIQITMTGARLKQIPGSRDDTAKAVLKAAQKIYYASHSWNPFFLHGTKTFSFEVCEQLGWSAPNAVVLPAGNGTLLIGAYIGFRELKEAGIIKRIPKIIAVQASNCAPLYKAFHKKKSTYTKIRTKPTLAEGIAIAEPVRGAQILEIVTKTGGTFIAVSETSIKQTFKEMARMGHYIEPTSASVIAGLKHCLKTAKKNERIVSTFTGSGLKATSAVLKML